MRKKIAIFCSATNMDIHTHDRVYKLAYELSKHFDLVYGGAGDDAGLMTVVKRAFLDGGAKVYAFPMRQFVGKEGIPFDGEIVEWCDNLGSRITKMESLADGFLILHGGIGTLMELATVYCNKQSKISVPKPIIVDNTEHYYDDIYHFMHKNKIIHKIGSYPEKYIEWISTYEKYDIVNIIIGLIYKNE